MTNDAELLRVVRGALIVALPDDTPHDVIEDAALNVLEALHGPWFPASEKACCRREERQPARGWRRHSASHRHRGAGHGRSRRPA